MCLKLVSYFLLFFSFSASASTCDPNIFSIYFCYPRGCVKKALIASDFSSPRFLAGRELGLTCDPHSVIVSMREISAKEKLKIKENFTVPSEGIFILYEQQGKIKSGEELENPKGLEFEVFVNEFVREKNSRLVIKISMLKAKISYYFNSFIKLFE